MEAHDHGGEAAAAALCRLLEERTDDVRELDVEGFRGWLERHLERWRRDEVFVQRTRIRDVRRGEPRLRELERRQRITRAAYESSPGFAALEKVEREMADAGKAVAGLAGALEGAGEEERPRLRQKLQGFEARETALREERARLADGSEARQALDRVTDELAELRSRTGLDALEDELAGMQRERGRRSGHSGARFEEEARAAVERQVLPGLSRGGAGESLRILTGVTLGAARTEIDLLVVRVAADANEAVEVLAMAEAKHNPNDLAHGFRQRQENLAWLTGERGGYDPAAMRTRAFPSGHFDRPAHHEQDGQRFRITRDSFRRFGRDPASGLFLARLHLVTRPGTLWGLGSRELARLAHRASADEEWAPESDGYLSGLLRWCRSLAHPLESPDVLRLYARSEALARHVVPLS